MKRGLVRGSLSSGQPQRLLVITGLQSNQTYGHLVYCSQKLSHMAGFHIQVTIETRDFVTLDILGLFYLTYSPPD